MATIEVLKRDDLKAMLLDAVTDEELTILIDHLTEARAALVARQCVAPCDQDNRAQALACEVSIRDFREEVQRRAGLTPSQRMAEEVART